MPMEMKGDSLWVHFFCPGTSINHVDQLDGVNQISILLLKSYLVKVTMKGGGGDKNTKNFGHVVYE